MPTKTETATCWRIVLPTGEDHDMGEGVRHFDTERDAIFEVGEYVGATATPFPAPCVTVTCDECEETLSSEEFSTLHFESVGEAHDTARACDWTVSKNGRMHCWDCPVLVDPDTTGETETR